MTEETTRAELYAAGVIPRRGKNGYEVLVMDVERLDGPKVGKKLVMFAGGKSEPRDKGDHIKVLRRELREELWLRLKDDATAIPLAKVPHRGHLKKFLLVWRTAFKGKLRTVPIFEGKPGARKQLGVPRWVSLKELEATICKTHKVALPGLRRVLSLPPRTPRAAA